jgi:uncharacterized membrane-anchored protein
MKKIVLFGLACTLACLSVSAKNPEDSLQKMILEETRRVDSIENTLHYKTGKIELGTGIATINVPATFKFLGPEEARYVVTTLWGNPPSNNAPLGLLFPANSGATDPGGYAFIIQFEDIGYVKDGDADKMNYDDLLKDLKKSSAEDNIQRAKMGLYTMDLVGWAAKPYYDKQRKVLHWAKEFSIPGNEENTLNYDVRVLGRKGVLTLQAVSGMTELDSVNAHIDDVLAMVAFNDGHKYGDFNSSTDNVAAWTIGGLVAGKVLAKVGFFAVIMKFLKFIIIGLGLIGGAIWRFVTGRKKKEEEFVYQPQPAPAKDNETNTNPPA